jgi:hypothetical protein
MAALATGFRGITRVYQGNDPTGTFSLVRKSLHQVAPSRVQNTLCEVAMHHARDRKVFKCDLIVAGRKFARPLSRDGRTHQTPYQGLAPRSTKRGYGRSLRRDWLPCALSPVATAQTCRLFHRVLDRLFFVQPNNRCRKSDTFPVSRQATWLACDLDTGDRGRLCATWLRALFSEQCGRTIVPQVNPCRNRKP